MFQINHDGYMRHAIGLAANAPELPFGAVIVHRRSAEFQGQQLSARRA
jgi:tRNA(Arg) A34 adenosine deaminase TadA